MTIIRIILGSRAVQFWAFLAVAAALLISIGLQFDLNKSEWSGWAQAVGAFVAIMASGWIAGHQARLQLATSIRLQKFENARHAHQMAKATLVITERVSGIFSEIVREFAEDRLVFTSIANGIIDFDRNLLSEIKADVDAIPILDLKSSRVAAQVILMKSALRQAKERIEFSLTEHRTMNAADFIEFFEALNDLRDKLIRCMIEIRLVKRSIGSEITDLEID